MNQLSSQLRGPITNIIIYNMKGDWDLIVTPHDLLDNWCNGMSIKLHWVKDSGDYDKIG
jgi:hypothetical protein